MNTNKVSYQFPEHVPANIAARAYVEEEGTEGDMRHYLNVKRALEESGGDVHIPRKMAERLMKRFGGDIYGGAEIAKKC